jgi:hypothetical protein
MSVSLNTSDMMHVVVLLLLLLHFRNVSVMHWLARPRRRPHALMPRSIIYE